MGQEQSSGGIGEASSSSLSFLQKAKGISSPKSYRNEKIIVVSSGNSEQLPDPKQDEDYLKLQEIPQFYPVLRSNLNLGGLKDPPDLLSKISHKSLLGFCHRLQEHFIVTSEIVAAEQGSLGTRIREIDYAIATLANYLSDRQKAYGKYASEIHRIREVNAQLKKLSANLQQMVPAIQELNEKLPESERLPDLNLARFCVENINTTSATTVEEEVNRNFIPADNVTEQKVVDEQNIGSKQMISRVDGEANG